ncbi:hypothetical protein EHS17_03645 [Rhodobacteraceae bacterium CH30]|nr:hypothetical protein EHS17_03645 [Rhodobacteraceae bacterium CH30]
MFVSIRSLKQFLRPLSTATQRGVDLTLVLPEGRSALSDMAGLINRLFRHLHQAIGKIAGHAINLSQLATPLSEMAGKLESRAQAQEQYAEQIGRASQELSVTVQSIASSAAEASSFSGEVAQAVSNANASDQQNRRQIEAIGSSTETLARQMDLLKTSSDSIGEVVELIKSIADRTRLLSLNAAIEAARAGEEGRGFAVVADEVRKLADQTTQATQSVETLLANIQQQVATSGVTMQQMASLVQQGIVVSGEAGESIKAASRDITVLIEHVHVIADASGAQSAKVAAIASQIDGVVEGARQQLDDAHALAQSAVKVREDSDALLGEVGKFRLAGHQQSRDRIAQALQSWQLEQLDGEDLDRKLVALCRQEPALEMACVTDARGRQVSADVAPGHFDLSGRNNDWHDRRWFQDAVKARALVVSDLYRSVDTDQYCFTLSAPLFNAAGQLLGVFEGDVRFNHIVA